MMITIAGVLALLAGAAGGEQNGLTDEQKSDLSQYFGFGPMQIYKLKPGIGEMRLADLDGNGKLDIALWNPLKSRIELLYQPEGNAPVKVQPSDDLERNEIPNRGNMRTETVPVANRLASMEIADLTGDKRPDIVFFGEPKELVILPGKPEGGFGPADSIRAPDGEARGGALTVGDFNHDGKTDVALLGNDMIEVYYQKAEGGLAKPVRLVHGIKQPLLLLAADLNDDGRDDLILSADDDQFGVYVWLQESSGALGALRRVKVPKLRSMTVAKPGQGHPQHELYAVEYATGRLKQFRWEMPKEVGVQPDWPQRMYSYPFKASGKRRPLAIGDITGDGIADCIVADPDAAQLILFKGNENGLDPAVTFPGLSKTLDLCIADIDGDGRSELLSVSAAEKMIGVSRFADGRITFPSPYRASEAVEKTESSKEKTKAKDDPDEEGDESGGGQPLAVAVGSLKAGDKPEKIAFVRKSGDKAELVVANIRDGLSPVAISLTELEDDPGGLRFVDVDQDGANDILLFVRFNAPRVFLQKGGKFELFAGDDTRAGLVKEATYEGFDAVDVTGDGKPEMIVRQSGLARALVVKDGKWTVIDQYNPDSGDAQITGLSAIPDKSGSPIVVLYDRKAHDALVLRRREDKTYAVAQTFPVGNFELTAMTVLPLGKSGKPSLLMADADKIAVLNPNEVAPTLVEQHSYESEIKDGFLGDSVVGDVNGDGVRDVCAIDIGKARIEVLTTLADGGFVKALGFQVFQGRRFSDDPGTRGEPREVLCGDVTGDGRDDLAVIVHDRLIIYPGE